MKMIYLITCLFIAAPIALHAQPLLPKDNPDGENVRFAWAIDANDGVEDGQFEGFEVAYASKIYPLDQMVISYGYSNPDNNAMHSVLLAIEEYYPIAEVFKLYGVAGVGYIWKENPTSGSGNRDGFLLKIGLGGIYELNDAFDIYAELAYLGSDSHIWQDGPNEISTGNVKALIGFRFKY